MMEGEGGISEGGVREDDGWIEGRKGRDVIGARGGKLQDSDAEVPTQLLKE